MPDKRLLPARPSTAQCLSLVIPIFNEEPLIDELERRLQRVLASVSSLGLEWEVVFVNDGSVDGSLEKLRALAANEPRYRVISFSRNFGHQIAITAGLDRAEGDAVVVMDADLQDPPEVALIMIERWREGYDVVYGVRSQRIGESIFKRATAAAFYRVLQMLTGVEIPLDAGDFRLMTRRVVLTLRHLRERHRFVRGLVAWVGFRQTAVHYERSARPAGRTKYPVTRMIRFAFDGITSFSTVPLRLAMWLGLAGGASSILVGLWAAYVRLFTNRAVPGWTTVMVLASFGFSLQLLVTGILGEYLGRLYEEIKRRPLYVISEELNTVVPADEREFGPTRQFARVD